MATRVKTPPKGKNPPLPDLYPRPFSQENPRLRPPDWAGSTLTRNLYALFGERSYFVADSAATWPPDCAGTRTPAYQSLLNRGRIWVLCGRPSGNLGFVSFAGRQQLEAFLQNNPPLRNSLVTRRTGGYLLWFRSRDPASLHLLLSGGLLTTIARFRLVTPETLQESAYCTESPPALINFSELVWSQRDLFFLRWARLESQYGPSAAQGGANPRFYAALFSELRDICFDPLQQQFWRGLASQFESLSERNVLEEFLEAVALWSRTSPERRALVAADKLKIVLETLRTHQARLLPDPEAALREALERSLERREKANVTLGEIYMALHPTLQTLPQSATNSFNKTVAELVLRCFGVRLSKSVQRNGSSQNGFRGIGLKSAEP